MSAKIQLPCVGSMQIATVYRSPSVLQATFTTVLSRLLRHLSMCQTPCVILGDFNSDVLLNQNSVIVSIMSAFGYRQIVVTPTTSQGTLIDHVYYRNPCSRPDSAVVHVKDTYYSDHDTVYCKITV